MLFIDRHMNAVLWELGQFRGISSKASPILHCVDMVISRPCHHAYRQGSLESLEELAVKPVSSFTVCLW